jgi:hypothetical protein
MSNYIEDIKLCKNKFRNKSKIKEMNSILQKYIDQDNIDIILFVAAKYYNFLTLSNEKGSRVMTQYDRVKPLLYSLNLYLKYLRIMGDRETEYDIYHKKLKITEEKEDITDLKKNYKHIKNYGKVHKRINKIIFFFDEFMNSSTPGYKFNEQSKNKTNMRLKRIKILIKEYQDKYKKKNIFEKTSDYFNK